MGSRIRLLTSAVLVTAAGALAATPSALAHHPHARPDVRLQPIGRPAWKPVDLHQFSAPIGTAPDYTEFGTTPLAILPPPNHRAHPQLGVGPGDPHRGYDREIARGVRALGLHENGPFRLSEYSSGNGVWLAWMTVPHHGVLGSSPDFAIGQIIPNSLFPMRVSGISIHRGMQYSNVADFEVPKLDAALDPPFHVDGHSHFPIFLADNTDFATDPSVNPYGRYRWELTIVDQRGAGWRITARFTVRR